MHHDIIATELTRFIWLATGTVWDRDTDLYEQVRRTAAEMRWHSVTAQPSSALSHRGMPLDYLDSGLIAATGGAERTIWIGRAKSYRTKPVPFTLTGIREITAEGTRSLLMLTDDRGPVPIAIHERTLLPPDAASPCAAGHDHCPGRNEQGRTCPCSCGCRRPDRLTIYRQLVAGDEVTDPAWQWPFTVTAGPDADEHGGVSVEVRGDDEQVSEFIFRASTEPVIIHNAWRPGRTASQAAGPEPPV